MTSPITRPSRNHRDGFTLQVDSGVQALLATSPTGATGTVVCDANTGLADGDTVTLSDGVRTLVYEYDKSSNGVTAGHITWAAGTTAITVAANLVTAIQANQPALTVSNGGTATVTISNALLGAVGNVSSAKSSSSGVLAVTGMSGGTNASLASNISSTTTLKRLKIGANRVVRILRASLDVPAGFAQDASNYWTVSVNNGGTAVASWSTLTGAQGTISADVPVDLVLSTTHTDFLVGDVLSVVYTKTGSPAAFPASVLTIQGEDL